MGRADGKGTEHPGPPALPFMFLVIETENSIGRSVSRGYAKEIPIK
jgi:hypothetical protein